MTKVKKLEDGSEIPAHVFGQLIGGGPNIARRVKRIR